MLKQHNVIYESPDDVNYTVGSSERRLVHNKHAQHWRARWYKWEHILREAENNPALDDLVKKAEMIYDLTK